MSRTLFCISLAVVVSANCVAADEPSQASWQQWQPLIGNWKAEGSGSPGQSTGTFSFGFDLQNRVLVRKSHSEYPATDTRPAFAHDDLLILYRDESSHKVRGDYFDNEGHAIQYVATVSPDTKTITLVSDAVPGQPTFRLTYTVTSPARLAIKFEIAPPNAADKFQVYVQGTATKT